MSATAGLHVRDADHYDAIESVPWATVQEQTVARMPDQLDYLRERSSFYRSRLPDTSMDRFHTLDAFGDLPTMGKEDERAAQAEAPPLGSHLCADGDDLVSIQASSGSTGLPTYFALSSQDRGTWDRIVARTCWTSGMRPWDRVARLSTFAMFVGGLPAVSGVWHLGATVIPIGSTAGTERTLEHIEHLGATIVTCTPSFAMHLLDAIESGPPRKLGVELLILGGEPGAQSPVLRERISSGWSAQIRDVMGVGEIAPGCWSECGHGSGMHFTGQLDILPELIDPATEAPLPWETGVEGELVYTTVERQATPMLRFRSRDNIRVLDTTCACGRTSPKITVLGRTDDMFIVRGVNVFPASVRDVVALTSTDVTGRILIQLEHAEGQVTSPVTVAVELKPDIPDDARAPLARAIEDRIKGLLMFRAKVDVVGFGEIPATTHKARLVERAP